MAQPLASPGIRSPRTSTMVAIVAVVALLAGAGMAITVANEGIRDDGLAPNVGSRTADGSRPMLQEPGAVPVSVEGLP